MFCSQSFHIITSYAKDTNKPKFIWQILKTFLSYSSCCKLFSRPLLSTLQNLLETWTKKSNLALYCHDISILFQTLLIKCIPFFSSQSIEQRNIAHFVLISSTFSDTVELDCWNIRTSNSRCFFPSNPHPRIKQRIL